MGVVNELCILSPSLSLSLMIDYAQCSEITNYTGPVYIQVCAHAIEVLTIYAIDTASRLGLACTIKLKQKGWMHGRIGCNAAHGVDYGLLYNQDQAKDGWAQSNKKTIHARNVSWC